MRFLGIDYGERRIGVSVSDPTGTLASPLPTVVRRAGKRPPLKALEQIALEYEVAGIVMGLPLNLRGQETEWTLEVRSVGTRLGQRLGVPVYYRDERLTSVRAERGIRELGLTKRAREDKKKVDAAAAVLILQLWLDGNPESLP